MNNTETNEIQDSFSFEAMATIYNYWLLKEYDRSQLYIETIFQDLVMNKTNTSDDEKTNLQQYVYELDPKSRSSIVAALEWIVELLFDETLQNWARKFANEFENNNEKSYINNTSATYSAKWFQKLTANAKKQLETLKQVKLAEKQEEERLKKFAKKEAKRLRVSLFSYVFSDYL